MATVLEAPPQLSASQRFLLRDVSWQTYKVFARELEGRPALRLTFDGEDLEFMTISPTHGWYERWIGRLVFALCFELGIAVRSGGGFTHRRDDLERGFEPDDGFWIQSEPLVRGKLDIDLSQDPPTDLAIEVDISRSSLNRLAIYAAFRVPEVWRFDGRKLHVHLLRDDGTYYESETSAAFPFLPMDRFAEFIHIQEETSETDRLREFVDWIREQDFAGQL